MTSDCRHEYRECRDAAIEAYDRVYNDFNLTLQGEDVEFRQFWSGFCFAFSIDKLGDINWKFNCLFERWEKI